MKKIENEDRQDYLSKREQYEVLERLRDLEDLGDVAKDLLDRHRKEQRRKDSDFAKIFLTNLAELVNNEGSPLDLSRPEITMMVRLIPHMTYGGQIMLSQADMQAVCRYKSRDKFTKHLNSLLAKEVLLKQAYGRQNIWFFNPWIIKMGTDNRPSKIIKFKTKIPKFTESKSP